MDWSEAVTLILPGILGVLTPLLYGVARARYGILNYGPVAADQWSRPWYLLAIIAYLIFAFVGISRIMASRRYFAIYEGGVAHNLGRKMTFAWEEIAGITTETTQNQFLGILLRPYVQGYIYPNIGEPVRLDNAIQNLPELLTILKAKLYPRLLPRLQSNLESGQWLYFGSLAIQQKGIKLLNKHPSNRAQAIPWSQITFVNIESGYMVVELSDRPRLKLPVSKIPNIELLLQLIKMGVNS